VRDEFDPDDQVSGDQLRQIIPHLSHIHALVYDGLVSHCFDRFVGAVTLTLPSLATHHGSAAADVLVVLNMRLKMNIEVPVVVLVLATQIYTH
jgi:hypothetical protein